MSSNLLLDKYKGISPPTLEELRKKKKKEGDKDKKEKKVKETVTEGVKLLRQSNLQNLLMANEFLP